MEGINELREMWRQKRNQKLLARLQSKQRGQSKPLSDKILGFKLKDVKLSVPEMDIRLNSTFLPSNPPQPTNNIRKLSRCVSEPKIIPRETKLSMQRKAMLAPQYKIKKLLESKSAKPFENHVKSDFQVFRKNKHDKFPTPKITSHSCINLLDVQPRTDMALPEFSPLVKGLDSWLKKRGKRFTLFKNLKTVATEPRPFLKQRESNEKENSEPSLQSPPENYTSVSSETNSTVMTSQEEETAHVQRILEGGLEDLSAIIRMGYPVKDCQVWLSAMRCHYSDLMNYPLYWECAAAINSRMGIKQEQLPAEINKQVTTQVTDLVNKLKFLNLNTPKNEIVKEGTSQKRRILHDINISNVVNSSAIEFSIKKKENDRVEEVNYFVTPVRRSARKNKCMIHNKNKDVNCVKSLLDLSQEVRSRMEFEPNKALLNS